MKHISGVSNEFKKKTNKFRFKCSRDIVFILSCWISYSCTKIWFYFNCMGTIFSKLQGGNQMIGIRLIWECPSCGNIIKTHSPFWDADVRKKIKEPVRCGCGRKGKFNLLDFNKCTWLVMPQGTKIVDKEGKVLYEEGPDAEDPNNEKEYDPEDEEENNKTQSKEDEEEEIKD